MVAQSRASPQICFSSDSWHQDCLPGQRQHCISLKRNGHGFYCLLPSFNAPPFDKFANGLEHVIPTVANWHYQQLVLCPFPRWSIEDAHPKAMHRACPPFLLKYTQVPALPGLVLSLMTTPGHELMAGERQEDRTLMVTQGTVSGNPAFLTLERTVEVNIDEGPLWGNPLM